MKVQLKQIWEAKVERKKVRRKTKNMYVWKECWQIKLKIVGGENNFTKFKEWIEFVY